MDGRGRGGGACALSRFGAGCNDGSSSDHTSATVHYQEHLCSHAMSSLWVCSRDRWHDTHTDPWVTDTMPKGQTCAIRLREHRWEP